MYLHCKYGFVEADAWDGVPVRIAEHQAEIDSIEATVIVVRSRDYKTLIGLRGLLIAPRLELEAQPKIFASPPNWDYEWRMYLSAEDWSAIMGAVASGLDYRNFKNWTHSNSPAQSFLAHAIWQAASDAAHTRAPQRFVEMRDYFMDAGSSGRASGAPMRAEVPPRKTRADASEGKTRAMDHNCIGTGCRHAGCKYQLESKPRAESRTTGTRRRRP